ncbi:sialidase family protein [Chitinophaga sp.]|uniref:sialidase family protein n=1 Tax=Chitinophaga sp. TaxID=1869181 RepID=UPI0026103ADE|nr:sialidase family protein [uncultured Chitinophaga sp.]
MKASLLKFPVLLALVLASGAGLFAQQAPPGTIVTHVPAETKTYIGSPSLAILPDGSYVASHDFFGPQSSEFVQAVTRIFRSRDKGKSRQQVSTVNGAFWSSLFVHKDTLYLLGPDRHHGTVLIRRSADGGATWTQPATRENGLLLAGMYHCAPMPVLVHNGRIWRAMETAHGPVLDWGKRYGAMMMSLDGHFTGWLEGNAVAAPDGSIVNILRVDDRSSLDEKAAIVRISADGRRAAFDAGKDFIPFPGGSKKFVIRFDEKSGRYWTLANIIPQSFRDQYPKRNPATFRNTLALMSSADLRSWQTHEIVLQHPDVLHHGFQYVDWQFEGNDMIVLSRTAFGEGAGKAHNNHDANYLTFHRIRKFRELEREKE